MVVEVVAGSAGRTDVAVVVGVAEGAVVGGRAETAGVIRASVGVGMLVEVTTGSEPARLDSSGVSTFMRFAPGASGSRLACRFVGDGGGLAGASRAARTDCASGWDAAASTMPSKMPSPLELSAANSAASDMFADSGDGGRRGSEVVDG